MTSVAIWVGTLILFVPTPRGALVSADSRFDAGDPARRDEARKIFLCGRAAVCAVSGGLRLDATADESSGTLDISAALEAASVRMRANEDQSPAALLEIARTSLHGEMQRFWARFLAGRRVAAPLSARLGAPSVCTILLAAPGYLAQMQFPIGERRTADGMWTHELHDPVVRLADSARPLAQGHTECVSPPDKLPESAEQLDALYTPARALPFCSDAIGGPIDIAAIEDGQARWLRNKLPAPEKVDQPLPLPVH